MYDLSTKRSSSADNSSRDQEPRQRRAQTNHNSQQKRIKQINIQHKKFDYQTVEQHQRYSQQFSENSIFTDKCKILKKRYNSAFPKDFFSNNRQSENYYVLNTEQNDPQLNQPRQNYRPRVYSQNSHINASERKQLNILFQENNEVKQQQFQNELQHTFSNLSQRQKNFNQISEQKQQLQMHSSQQQYNIPHSQNIKSNIQESLEVQQNQNKQRINEIPKSRQLQDFQQKQLSEDQNQKLINNEQVNPIQFENHISGSKLHQQIKEYIVKRSKSYKYFTKRKNGEKLPSVSNTNSKNFESPVKLPNDLILERQVNSENQDRVQTDFSDNCMLESIKMQQQKQIQDQKSSSTKQLPKICAANLPKVKQGYYESPTKPYQKPLEIRQKDEISYKLRSSERALKLQALDRQMDMFEFSFNGRWSAGNK